MRSYLPILVASLIIAAGCSESKAPVVTVPAQPAPGAAPSPQEGGVTANDLSKAETNYKKEKAAYTAAPNDAAAKSKYVAATVAFGDANMMSDTLDRKVKYKEALKYYREALSVDPKNEPAKKSKELIESIYKQMGRPIPE